MGVLGRFGCMDILNLCNDAMRQQPVNIFKLFMRHYIRWIFLVSAYNSSKNIKQWQASDPSDP